MRIWMDPAKCRGCMRCELACSLHHSGHRLFNPEYSSTRVYRNSDSGKITMSMDETCDFCIDEDYPLCVRHCVFGARGVVA